MKASLLITAALPGFSVSVQSAVMFDTAKTGDFQADGSTTEFNLSNFTPARASVRIEEENLGRGLEGRASVKPVEHVLRGGSVGF